MVDRIPRYGCDDLREVRPNEAGRFRGTDGDGAKADTQYLLWALAGVAMVGLVLVVLWWGPWLLTRHPHQGLTADQELKAKNGVRTTLVQAVGGLALASGAIVTYRTFRHTRIEQDRAYKLSQSQQVTETYAKAVEQLGHDEAPVRLGAMYSLERLAQDNPLRRQTIVDVLCAYLRMPYTPPYGESAADHRNNAPTGVTQQATAVAPRHDPAQELSVRQTAQRLLADHLCYPRGSSSEDAQNTEASPEETFWPGISLDLTGAILVGLNLSRISVIHAAFTKATFSGTAGFGEANFSGTADFGGATFFRGANFGGVTFSGDAWFDGATFFRGANFGEVTFSGDAEFSEATFPGGANFGGVTFSGGAEFGGVTFSGGAEFGGATFSGDARFGGVTFSGTADFDGATFSCGARFRGATFSGKVWFGGATFPDGAGFGGVLVLRLDDPDLNKGGRYARRVWPDGWTVCPDANDPTRGTLVPFTTGADND
jgi:uncharacterized protein YjbI with pentapeptide repeats